MSISIYEFEMISSPKCLTFHHEDWKENDAMGIPLRYYRKILFKDSLFNFFPYSEVYYKDTSGQIIDNVFFIEGLQFECKLGYVKNEENFTEEEKNNPNRKDYLEHSYVWSEHEINNINISSSISGDNVFMLISKHFYNDYPKSKSFNHEDASVKQSISDILKNDILPSWGILPDKYKDSISTTDGKPYLIQNNITNKEFISKLSEYAYSTNNETSGFYTFFNCNGEFYFMSIKDLMNQNPIKKFKIDLVEGMMINDYYVKDYRVRFGGIPINFNNYNRKILYYTSNSNSNEEDKNIHSISAGLDSKTKLLIRKDHIPSSDFTHRVYAGIIDNTVDTELYKGFVNYYYRDSAMSYRMILVTDFDPNCVSGKTITIEVQKQTEDNEIATEFSGTWLICESIHVMDKNGIPYSQLTISKPQIQLDSNHPFINDFHA